MKHIKLSGTPKKIGLKHGEEFKNDIRELTEIRKFLINNFFTTSTEEQKNTFYSKQVNALKKHNSLFEEFSGIAEAANLSLNDLMILNNYTDMRDFEASGAQEEGCSVFYVKNNKGTFSGQTWDMHASATPYVLHLEIETPDRKLNIVTVTGCLALAGVSSLGHCVQINNMHCLESNVDGIMWPAAVRLMLEKGNCAETAKTTLQENIPSSGHNYLLSDANKGFNIETTGKQLDVTADIATNGHTFHTNHYVGKLSKSENLDRQSKTTKARYQALEALFKEEDWQNWSFEDLKSKILLEKASQILCIKEDANNPHAASTCGGIVVDYSSQHAEIFKGLYSENEKNSFDL